MTKTQAIVPLFAHSTRFVWGLVGWKKNGIKQNQILQSGGKKQIHWDWINSGKLQKKKKKSGKSF